MSEPLIIADHVSKKFCRSLKKAMWYGLCDMTAEVLGGRHSRDDLRPSEFWAVKDVSFELRRGEALGLIGHNGAGKTTLLKILNGLIKPDSGSVTIRGRVGALIALGAGFNPILTGRENIYVNGAVLGLERKEVDAKLDAIIDFSGVRDFIDAPVQSYSSGMTVRLGFAVASCIMPDILLVDEVLAVGDLAFVFKCFNRMAEILPHTAIVFVSHSMPLIARTCTSALLMDHGQVEYLGDDVARAIQQYSCMVPTGGRKNDGGTELELVDLKLNLPRKSAADPQVGELRSGESLEVLVTLESRASTRIEFNPFMKILDQQLREVVDFIPHSSRPLYGVEPGARLSYTVNTGPLYLNRGPHSLVISAFEPVTKRNFMRVSNAASFYNEAPYHGWAVCTMPGTWQKVH